MPNKLKGTMFFERTWGSEIIWSLTDKYMAKTIEIKPSCTTELLVHENRDKSIIVIKGPMFMVYGTLSAKDVAEAYKLPEGWSWHIEAGSVCSYMAMDDPVLLIEVSSSDIDDGRMLVKDGDLEFTKEDFVAPPMK